MPIPITAVTDTWLARLSARIPAHLACPISTSLGHLSRSPAGIPPPASAIASTVATPASSESCGTTTGGQASVTSRLA